MTKQYVHHPLIRRYIVRYPSKEAGHAIYHTSICFLAHVLFIAGPSQRPPIKHGQNTCPVVRLIEQPKYSIAYWQPWSRHEHQIIYITTGSRHTVMMNKAGWHIAKSQPALQTKHICKVWYENSLMFSWFKLINVMVGDALASCVDRPSAPMILTM